MLVVYLNRVGVPPRGLVVHLVAFCWFSFVWLWHLTPAASQLPGNFGFGWFFRFLTFYSFSLQTLQLGMATLDDLQRTWYGKSRWTKPTDDLACAIFAFTHVVSIMFYTIQSTTKMAVEGGHVVRPPWLDVSVHAFNTMVAWADLITSDRRSFSRTSERLSSVLVMGYLSYLMLCRHMNGRFPYPILNALSYPWGVLGLVGAGLLLFTVAFRAGKLMNRKLRHVSLAIRITERVSDGGSEHHHQHHHSSSSCVPATPVGRKYLQFAFIKRRRSGPGVSGVSGVSQDSSCASDGSSGGIAPLQQQQLLGVQQPVQC